MGAEHTSVPRWPAQVPPPDPAARSLALLGFGASGERAVRAWRQQLDTGKPVWFRTADRATAGVLAELEQQVAQAVVGWRLLLAGPEADVLAARAVAVRLGVIDAEIRMAVDDATRKRVYCAHCAVTTETDQPVSGETPCRGCGRRLHVYAHVSRLTGAYLGFQADAEDVA